MMYVFAATSFLAICSSVALGQSPAFEVADVHASNTPNPLPYMTGGVLRGGRYDLRNATMLDLIKTAYGVDVDTVQGGPAWLEFDRFDIVAKAPADTSREKLNPMLQALLAERFKLRVHKDTRPMPAFALEIAKGKPKLKEADGSGNTGCFDQPQKLERDTTPFIVLSCRNVTMEAFAQNLRQISFPYISVPVVNRTVLEGSWDFDLKFTSSIQLARAGADGITIFDAVDKQLGLKLQPTKIPTSVIIVDSVNQKPTANQPDVTRSLPPPLPEEFEVAVVKPSLPDTVGNMRVQPGGEIEMQALTLKTLIGLAWHINPDTKDMIVNAPKFLDTNRFDILARTRAGAGLDSAHQIDMDDLMPMLRALLADRFRLATHVEDRPVAAYKLVAVKPKLRKANPAYRTGWKEGPGPDGKDPRIENPLLSRLVTCRNMTMAQFGQILRQIASGSINSPVLDATGLVGAYDFTLSFSSDNLVRSAPTRLPGGDSAASDPSGAVSIFDAVSGQLGLKLVTEKRSLPVLVIDRVEEKPTPN